MHPLSSWYKLSSFDFMRPKINGPFLDDHTASKAAGWIPSRYSYLVGGIKP